MNTQAELKLAHQRLDNLTALSNKDLLERAWNELSALCGSNKGPPKEWTMTIPVDADRDSDVLFGEVLMRFVKLEAVAKAVEAAAKRMRRGLSPQRSQFRCSHCGKNTPLLIDGILALADLER